jgi:hypothetical protein
MCELSHINLKHPDFIGSGEAFRKMYGIEEVKQEEAIEAELQD